MHQPPEVWRLFWAKTNREKVEGLPDDWTHPLWAHLIDVGSAAQILWDEFLPASLKRIIAAGIGMNETEAGQFLSIWIGLHDLGKGIPSFQEMNEPAKQRLIDSGFAFRPNLNRLHHGHASIAIAYRWLGSKEFDNDTLLHALAAFVGIHHGKLCQSKVWKDVAKSERPEGALGDDIWKQAQHDLTEAVFAAWGADLPAIAQFRKINTLQDPWPDWLIAFAGWATLADWLGSMQSCYDVNVQATDDLRIYVASSREGAKEAYKTAGLNQQANLRALPFREHFGNDPRPLQSITATLPLSNDQPNLVIAEAPTGEGKTEAGFYLTARHGGGVYVAMPSQSTSDGLFPRLQTFISGNQKENLKAAHVGDTAALRLVHGNDLLHDDALSLLKIAESTARIDDDDDQKNGASGGRVLGWFMPKKRALLVPYGVGTVDQLFLGVLYAKHFFLRLFALSGKTVIFDEVHAYDAYMNTVFGQLLRWLRALNVHVVVLSATLPTEARQRMLEAWGSPSKPETPGQPAPYPVVWHAAAGITTPHPFAPASDRTGQQLTFRWCGAEVETIVETARQLLAQKATVMIVCNTVKRAQEVFALLDTNELLPDEADRMLLHARMPQAWRQEREKAARERFGPKRPKRPGLLVGTQVIEQSLDLDVDALITDLAPVDLLLQRAGRLHRHKRKRPTGFAKPILYIACANSEPGQLPDVKEISGGGRIYETALMWKTWAVLRQVGGWALPLGKGTQPGYRALIEAIYGDAQTAPDVLDEASKTLYNEAFPKWEKEDRRMSAKAAEQLVPQPEYLDELFTPDKPELADDDDPKSTTLPKYLKASTRNPDSINVEVLLLYRGQKGWSIEPNGEIIIQRRKGQWMNPQTLRKIFGAGLRISDKRIVFPLLETKNTDWATVQENQRVLKRFHLIELTDALAMVGDVQLTLNNRLGLVYNDLKKSSP